MFLHNIIFLFLLYLHLYTSLGKAAKQGHILDYTIEASSDSKTCEIPPFCQHGPHITIISKSGQLKPKQCANETLMEEILFDINYPHNTEHYSLLSEIEYDCWEGKDVTVFEWSGTRVQILCQHPKVPKLVINSHEGLSCELDDRLHTLALKLERDFNTRIRPYPFQDGQEIRCHEDKNIQISRLACRSQVDKIKARLPCEKSDHIRGPIAVVKAASLYKQHLDLPIDRETEVNVDSISAIKDGNWNCNDGCYWAAAELEPTITIKPIKLAVVTGINILACNQTLTVSMVYSDNAIGVVRQMRASGEIPEYGEFINFTWYNSKMDLTDKVIEQIKIDFVVDPILIDKSCRTDRLINPVWEVLVYGWYLDDHSIIGACNCFPGNGIRCDSQTGCICRLASRSREQDNQCKPYLTDISLMDDTSKWNLVIRGGLLKPELQSQSPLKRPSVYQNGKPVCTQIESSDENIKCRLKAPKLDEMAAIRVEIPIGSTTYMIKTPLFLPSIKSIQPKKAILKSPIVITLHGQNLDYLHYPVDLKAHLHKGAIFETSCDKRSMVVLECLLKFIPYEEEIVDMQVKVKYREEWLMYQGSLNLYPKPDVSVATCSIDFGKVHLQGGSHLTGYYMKVDYQVTVGETTCLIQDMTDQSFSCITNQTANLRSALKIMTKEGDIGSVNCKVEETELEEESFVLMGGLLAGGLLMTAIVVLLFIYVKRFQFCPNLSKVRDINMDNSNLDTIELVGKAMDVQQPIASPSIIDRLDGNLQRIVRHLLLNPEMFQIHEVIGQGAFGTVHRAKQLCEYGESRTVAAKTITVGINVSTQELTKFLEEVTMMKDFDHPNVLCLIGIIADENRVYVILPYMEKGDLRTYVSGQILNISQFMRYCLDVARGMEYLAKLKFIHRDLAARNCMVDGQENVLVGDFGLARDIYHADYYKPNDQLTPLPYKWMALESLERDIFSSQSDVWSYGVLLWEVFNRGGRPYPNVSNIDLPEYIRQGHRLPTPEGCPYYMYHLMIDCWNANPHERPNFSDIVSELIKFIDLETEESRKDLVKEMENENTEISFNMRSDDDGPSTMYQNMQFKKRRTINEGYPKAQILDGGQLCYKEMAEEIENDKFHEEEEDMDMPSKFEELPTFKGDERSDNNITEENHEIPLVVGGEVRKPRQKYYPGKLHSTPEERMFFAPQKDQKFAQDQKSTYPKIKHANQGPDNRSKTSICREKGKSTSSLLEDYLQPVK